MFSNRRILLTLCLLSLATLTSLSFADSVCSVHDGDTLTMCSGTKVRLFGVDSPELKQTFGYQAKARMVQLVQSQDVRLTCQGKSYKRQVCQVWRGNQDIAAAMVLSGYAFDCPQYSHGFYQKQENAAKVAHVGVWVVPDGGQRPWTYRHNRYGKKETNSIFL